MHEPGSVLFSQAGCRLEKGKPKRAGVLVASLEGSVGWLLPLDEAPFLRLSLLQRILAMTLVHGSSGAAGGVVVTANPRDLRVMRTERVRQFTSRYVAFTPSRTHAAFSSHQNLSNLSETFVFSAT
jgi:hypothetical protein